MALQITAESPPDLIVLDIMMPEMDGYEVRRRIRADNGLKHPRGLRHRAQGGGVRTTGLELGAADYLTKPINVAIARKRISNLLEREAPRTQVEVQRSELETKVAELSRPRSSTAGCRGFSHMKACSSPIRTDGILDVNEALVELTGYRREEMLGNTRGCPLRPPELGFL